MLMLALANWPIVAAALCVLLLALWLTLRGRGKPRARHHAPDVLDAGSAPASRNQALIDALKVSVEPVAAKPIAIPPGGDDLTRIKGLGPKLVQRLGELGVNSYAQIAAWDDAELARIDGQLGAFSGRPARDNWIEQAHLLSKGDIADYEAKFGKL